MRRRRGYRPRGCRPLHWCVRSRPGCAGSRHLGVVDIAGDIRDRVVGLRLERADLRRGVRAHQPALDPAVLLPLDAVAGGVGVEQGQLGPAVGEGGGRGDVEEGLRRRSPSPRCGPIRWRSTGAPRAAPGRPPRRSSSPARGSAWPPPPAGARSPATQFPRDHEVLPLRPGATSAILLPPTAARQIRPARRLDAAVDDHADGVDPEVGRSTRVGRPRGRLGLATTTT